MDNETKENRACKQNAYFTLEACMIMPFVLGVIILVMYWGFYSYDKCISQQDVYRLLIRGCQIKDASNEYVLNKIKEESERFGDKYVMYISDGKRVAVEHNSINISEKGVLNVKVPFIEFLFEENIWSINTESKTTRIHPIETIRLCKKVESLNK